MVRRVRRTGSRVSQKGRPQQAYGNEDLLYSRQFSAPTKWSLAHMDNRAARAAKKTRSRYHQIGPLDNNKKKSNICVSLAHTSIIFSTITKLIKSCVMEWSGRRTGHRQQSQSKSEITAGEGGSHVLMYSSRQFSAHTKSSLANKRAARAARNTRYRYNQIGPLDHKMADNCVSLARTNTVSSTDNE